MNEENKNKMNEENSNEQSDGDLISLANQISALMKNDAMPERLFNALADELSHAPRDWRTPENILENLKEMKRAEGESE